MADAVVWNEIPDDEADTAAPDEEREAEVDETMATRRLRHWLRGMFGGRSDAPDAAEPE
jgi:hypothetical protein